MGWWSYHLVSTPRFWEWRFTGRVLSLCSYTSFSGAKDRHWISRPDSRRFRLLMLEVTPLIVKIDVWNDAYMMPVNLTFYKIISGIISYEWYFRSINKWINVYIYIYHMGVFISMNWTPSYFTIYLYFTFSYYYIVYCICWFALERPWPKKML